MSAAAPLRRGWCPGLARPMRTGDGLLARLHPIGGMLTAEHARAVAAAARLFGNGLVDITSRGNLQIRGLSEATHPLLVDTLLEAGIVEPARAEPPYRVTIGSPLAGLDPSDLVDACALALAIERAAEGCADLPAKFAIAVDGGGAFSLDAVPADLRLIATATPAGIVVALALAAPAHSPHPEGGARRPSRRMIQEAPEPPSPYTRRREGPAFPGASFETPRACGPRLLRTRGEDGWDRDVVGALRPDDVVAAIRTIFERLPRLSRSARIRDLPAHERAALLAGIALEPAPERPHRPSARRTGLLPIAEGRVAALVAAPSGSLAAQQLDDAAAWSEHYGAGDIRLAAGRGLCLPGLSAEDAPRVLALAEEAGFVVRDDDPRLAVVACAGAPACASGARETRADAARIAAAAPGLARAGLTVHLSGCEKGCAHPAPADLTLVGSPRGYGLVIGGRAGDAPLAHLPLETIANELGRLRSRADLASLVGEDRS